jgi:hypothetical protein
MNLRWAIVSPGAAMLALLAGCRAETAQTTLDGGAPQGPDATANTSDTTGKPGSAADEDSGRANAGGAGASQGNTIDAGSSQSMPAFVATDGGADDAGRVVLVDGLTNPSYIAVDATQVYFVAGSSGATEAVMSVPIAGGTPTVLASTTTLVHGLAVYGGVVYWTTGDSVMSIPAGGGSPSPVATGEANAFGPAVNANGVFWSTPKTAAPFERRRSAPRRRARSPRTRSPRPPSRSRQQGSRG